MVRRRRRVRGLAPLLVERVKALGRWLLHHPHPFLLAVGLTAALWAVATYAQQTEAFRIHTVQWPPETSFELREPLIGKNLWAVDLVGVAEELRRQQPWLKEVRVVRQLPDTLQIDAVPRQPAAQVWLKQQWFPVDREGFILPWGSREPASGLVRLVGFQPSAGALRLGADNTNERLQLGLRVLEALQRAPTSIARRVTELDVADPQQIRFLLDDVEVRCGAEADLAAHLDRLQAVLKIIHRQSLAVQYIDLRFQEPVIGS
ncbi:MAG: cell division protein FtsQ/DivIB [Candidatus Omnitrophota bacterium]|nr:cell division protein FtsQ/DivIB [Candidatus Omnitrophota bacterium]